MNIQVVSEQHERLVGAKFNARNYSKYEILCPTSIAGGKFG